MCSSRVPCQRKPAAMQPAASLHERVQIVDQEINQANTSLSYTPLNYNSSIASVYSFNLSIPSSAVRKAHTQFNLSNTIRSVFTLYETDILFRAGSSRSQIVAAEIASAPGLSNLKEPITIQYLLQPDYYGKRRAIDQLKSKFVEQKCVSWDEAASDWSSNGICLEYGETPPLCKSSHLTHFALLVATSEVPNDVALSITSDIGCAVSIAGLCLTSMILLFYKELRSSKLVKIQLHGHLNLMVTYLIFLCFVGNTGDVTTCHMITGLLHFFFLSAWMWIAVYSYQLYKSLVKVFFEDTTNYLAKACAFAYGLPALVVCFNSAITLGYLDKQQVNDDICPNQRNPLTTDPSLLKSHYRASHMCWLHQHSLNFGFLFIVGVVLVNNFVIFVLVAKNALFTTQKGAFHKKQRSKSKSVIMSLILFLMLGLTWIIGFVMLFSTDPTYNLVMSWIFAILNSFQGAVVFYVACVRRDDVFNTWTKSIREFANRTRKRAADLHRRVSQLVTTTTVTSQEEIQMEETPKLDT